MKLIDERKGFWWAYNDLFDFELSVRAIAVYCLLCRMVGNFGQDVMPSHKYIGEKLGIKSRTTVIKAIKELEDKLLIAVSNRTENGQKTNVYTIADGRRNKGKSK